MNRRAFLTGTLATAGALPATGAAYAAVSNDDRVMGATLNPSELRLSSGNHTGVVQRLLDEASDQDREVTLPAGSFLVSELRLPPRTRLSGVPGATRLVFRGGAHMVVGDRCDIVSFRGITFDGASLPIDDYVPGIVHLSNVREVMIDECRFEGSFAAGLALDRCGGRVTRSTMTRCHTAGLRAIESVGLSITDNTVSDCSNNGILVFRWSEGEDGTLVTGNRIENIRAEAGGTGQNGNGINVFRAHGVVVANNRIADCAFSAMRANSANNVQMTGNSCLRSGETSIYSEFSFEGAIIANNLIDGAGNGISVTNFNEGGRVAVVNGNIVRNLVPTGPYEGRFGTGIFVEADTSVLGNVVEGAPLFGMILGYGPYLRDVAASGNVIRDARVGIGVSVVEGARSTVISDNLISGAREGAIVATRWEEIVSGDLSTGGGESYRHLQIERNRVS